MTPADLPTHLAERVRPVPPAPRPAAGEFVLYWMHHAVRAEENPALDVACVAAHRLGRPLLVYQGLGGGHRYDSDRHHTFILEGARDVVVALRRRGVRHVFHLARGGSRSGALRGLAARSALVVTEDFPAPPLPRWTALLAKQVSAPVWCVDSACVLPMQACGRAFERAFEFRRAFNDEQKRRAARPWPAAPDAPLVFEGDLGFEPLDLAAADIAALCAACDIDHAMAPAPRTRGGSVAGEARWAAFRHVGLNDYSRLRDDAAVSPPRGVSRISPYLHHGHLSPLRVARETLVEGSSGARKFLDELLTWRELAHNFCFHRSLAGDDLETLAVLPEWSRETLAAHAGDPREALYTWEQLARGATADPLWNAAQASLRVHGELHNNLRMTWGKRFLDWSADPQRALDLMVDLNHRYALDGSDPNSYGGLLYCLGLFDRPFSPQRPVSGTVRGRSSAAHMERLDFDRYRSNIARSRPLSVAVVGAGVSGLAAARTLADQGLAVRVFERGRGVGGRAATRRGEGGAFDHGAQYFTARDPSFKRHVRSWVEQGCVAPWPVRASVDGEPGVDGQEARYVGVPGMAALARHLAGSLDVRLRAPVEAVRREHGRWHLQGSGVEEGAGFDVLVLAMPPEQALPLLDAASALATRARRVRSRPCWCAMVAFDAPLDIPHDALSLHAGPLAWAARDSAKPGRDAGERWVLHATPDWSMTRLDDDPVAIARQLLAAFFAASGLPPRTPVHLAGHRWRHARVADAAGEDCLLDGAARLALCGDWCRAARVEDAFLSGIAAAGRVAAAALNGL